MAIKADIVIEIAQELMEEAGFIHDVNIQTREGHHVTYKSTPDQTIKAIIIGCVYIGQILEDQLSQIWRGGDDFG